MRKARHFIDGTKFAAPDYNKVVRRYTLDTENQMVKKTLSNKTKKCLSNQIGEEAAKEIYDVINRLVYEIERLEKNKVSVTRIVKDAKTYFHP